MRLRCAKYASATPWITRGVFVNSRGRTGIRGGFARDLRERNSFVEARRSYDISEEFAQRHNASLHSSTIPESTRPAVDAVGIQGWKTELAMPTGSLGCFGGQPFGECGRFSRKLGHIITAAVRDSLPVVPGNLLGTDRDPPNSEFIAISIPWCSSDGNLHEMTSRRSEALISIELIDSLSKVFPTTNYVGPSSLTRSLQDAGNGDRVLSTPLTARRMTGKERDPSNRA